MSQFKSVFDDPSTSKQTSPNASQSSMGAVVAPMFSENQFTCFGLDLGPGIWCLSGLPLRTVGESCSLMDIHVIMA